jgi:hypothetical protein
VPLADINALLTEFASRQLKFRLDKGDIAREAIFGPFGIWAWSSGANYVNPSLRVHIANQHSTRLGVRARLGNIQDILTHRLRQLDTSDIGFLARGARRIRFQAAGERAEWLDETSIDLRGRVLRPDPVVRFSVRLFEVIEGHASD